MPSGKLGWRQGSVSVIAGRVGEFVEESNAALTRRIMGGMACESCMLADERNAHSGKNCA